MPLRKWLLHKTEKENSLSLYSMQSCTAAFIIDRSLPYIGHDVYFTVLLANEITYALILLRRNICSHRVFRNDTHMQECVHAHTHCNSMLCFIAWICSLHTVLFCAHLGLESFFLCGMCQVTFVY